MGRRHKSFNNQMLFFQRRILEAQPPASLPRKQSKAHSFVPQTQFLHLNMFSKLESSPPPPLHPFQMVDPRVERFVARSRGAAPIDHTSPRGGSLFSLIGNLTWRR